MQGRAVVGLGIDTLSIDYGPSKTFQSTNTPSARAPTIWKTSQADVTPESGAIVVVVSIKTEGGSGGQVRILALVR